MEIEFIKNTQSTQKDAIFAFKNNLKTPPFAIVAQSQSAGIGSRGNTWHSDVGNLYFSFCIDLNDIAADIPLNSYSIYFALIMRRFLVSLDSKVWIKWPNDFYVGDKKVGGVITNKIKNVLICGIGINLKSSPYFASVLDIDISPTSIVYGFFDVLRLKIFWVDIFKDFSVEFEKSKRFCSHLGNEIIELKSAVLCDDGSILIDNAKRIYSLR